MRVVFLQDIFNLLPNMNVEALSTSLAVKGNDMMAVIYLASLIRRWGGRFIEISWL
jgi:hypothetical protein